MDEDNVPYEAEALLHNTVPALSEAQYDVHSGELNALATSGGIDSIVNGKTAEQQPLITRPITDRSGTSKQVNDENHGHVAVDWDGVTEFEHLPWYHRPSVYWVLVPFIALAVSYGGLIAPRVQLIIDLTCREYFADQSRLDPTIPFSPLLLNGSRDDRCRTAAVQSRASQFNLYGNLIAGLLSAITSPKIGSLSDRYGRTKFIALTSLGSLTGEVIFILAAKQPETFHMNWILFGFALDGICGSFTTAFSIVHAYTSDCVPPEGRSVVFSMFHGCLFSGLAIGPVLTAFITKWSGTPVAPFYVIFGVHVLFMLFVGLVAPESLSMKRQIRARMARKIARASLPTGDWIDHLRTLNLLEPLKILWPTGPGSSHALRMNLSILAAIDFVTFSIALGAMSVVLMYGNFRFGWQTYESGIFMSITSSSRVACLVLVLPLVIRLFHKFRPAVPASKPTPAEGADKFDLGVIRTAVFFDMIGYIGYALSPAGAYMVLSGVVASMGGIGSPTLQASLTKHVSQDEVGQLLGASGLLHALARVLAPAVCNGIYSLTVSTAFPQAIFVCLAGAFGVAFALSWMLRTGVSYADDQHEPGAESGFRDQV